MRDEPQYLEEGIGLKDEEELLLQSPEGFKQPSDGRKGSPWSDIGGHIQQLSDAAEGIHEVAQLLYQTLGLLPHSPSWDVILIVCCVIPRRRR